MKKITFFLALFLSVMGVGQVHADELTVFDGTDQSYYVPIYAYYVDNVGGARTEFIIPKEMLADMAGCDITSMSFYLTAVSQKPASWNGVLFDVYVREVDEDKLTTGYKGYDDKNADVYEGQIDATQSTTLTINFTKKVFSYSGEKNLLIGIYNENAGDYEQCYFYGVNGEYTDSGVSMYGSSGSKSTFRPKTTFTYEGGVAYTLAGCVNNDGNASFFENAWDPSYTSNDLKRGSDGKYTKTFTNVSLSANDQIKFKVVKDHSWDVSYPAENYVKTISETGTYDLTFSYDPENNNVDLKVYRVISAVNVRGDFNNWTDGANVLTYNSETGSYEGIIDLSNTMADQQFKLHLTFDGMANDDAGYLGWQDKLSGAVTLVAPEGWVYDYNNASFYLKNSTTQYKTYNVTATWTPSDNPKTGWTLTIAGKDKRTQIFNATFVNNPGWTNVYAYVWSGSSPNETNKALGNWPGTKLTAGADGKYAVEIEAVDAPEHIIFNNGPISSYNTTVTEQTADLTFVVDREYELFYEGFAGTSLEPVNSIDGWDIDVTEHEGAGGYYGRMQYYTDSNNNNATVVFYYVTGDNDKAAYLITPKLHISGTDDAFYMRTNGLSDGKITVSYSADKNNWTQISQYSCSSYTGKSFKNIPEGDYYIKIELWNGTIDYFYGYELAASTYLELSENDEESMVVAGTYDEVTVEFTMGAGKFAAICLPFATTTTALGEGVKAWAFNGYDGNISLTTTNDLEAGKPYVVYAANGVNGFNFQNVTIASNEAGSVEQGAATFQGSYVKMPAGTMTGKYGVTPAGKIQKAGESATMKAFRGYFDLPTNTQNVKVSFDGIATGIDAAEVFGTENGEMYDLQGRRVNNTQKGIYIQNGKKFVVK